MPFLIIMYLQFRKRKNAFKNLLFADAEIAAQTTTTNIRDCHKTYFLDSHMHADEKHTKAHATISNVVIDRNDHQRLQKYMKPNASTGSTKIKPLLLFIITHLIQKKILTVLHVKLS